MAVTRDFATGFLIGAGVGAVSTLLMAPRSGEETRRAMAQKKDEWKDLTAAKASDYRSRGDDAMLKGRETLKATKEGLKDAGRRLVEPKTEERSA